MKICITRNCEARTNAAIARVTEALETTNNKYFLLSRNRCCSHKVSIIKSEYKVKKHKIPNYEIQLRAETGRGIKNIFQLIYFQFVVAKWLLVNDDKYDVIHSFDLDTGLPVFFVSKLKNKKYIYHIADFYVDSRYGIPKIIKKIVKKLEYLVIANAETTIICTEERRHQIEGSKPKNLVVVHNTPSKNISDIVQNNDLINNCCEDKKITFTYVGSLSEKRFIRSIIDIFKQHTEFKLEIAGMGELCSYIKLASKQYENINYYGVINYEEALKLYSTCDVMFAIYDPNVPNHKYSAPNKVYEAMMLGKPIIVAKGTGIDKIVENEKMGFIINYAKGDFERILKEIYNNRSILLEMGANARKAYAKYSWDEMQKRLISVYKSIKSKNQYFE